MPPGGSFPWRCRSSRRLICPISFRTLTAQAGGVEASIAFVHRPAHLDLLIEAQAHHSAQCGYALSQAELRSGQDRRHYGEFGASLSHERVFIPTTVRWDTHEVSTEEVR